MTLSELRATLERRAAEAEAIGATAPVASVYRAVLDELRPLADGNGVAVSAGGVSWRERLWTCPPDTRLGVREVAEALGRQTSWVYRAASAWVYRKGEAKRRRATPLPCQRLDGELVFEAGAVRTWITQVEQPPTAGRPGRRRPRRAAPAATDAG